MLFCVAAVTRKYLFQYYSSGNHNQLFLKDRLFHVVFGVYLQTLKILLFS